MIRREDPAETNYILDKYSLRNTYPPNNISNINIYNNIFLYI